MRTVSDLVSRAKKPKVKNALPGVLGDAFLIKYNPIYQLVREQILKSGYKFEPAERALHYTEWPLMYLDVILKKKKIPYYNNLKALSLLPALVQKQMSLEEFMSCPPFGNYILHESAHCLIDSLWTKKKDIFYYLLAESCASATEALSHIFVEDEEHQFYLSFNNYLLPQAQDIQVMRKICEKQNLEDLLKFLICLYLYANHMQGPLSEVEIKSLGFKDTALLKKLASMPLRLSTKFRTETTEIYLLKQGFKRQEIALQRTQNLISLIAKNESIINSYLRLHSFS